MNYKIPILFFILGISIHMRAQETLLPMKDPAAFRQKLNESTQKTVTIESSFTQEKNLSVVSERIITHGMIYFKKSNKLRWEYTNPFKYVIILNNGKITIRDESKTSNFDAHSNPVFGEINTILLGCTQGTLLNDDEKFQSSFFELPAAYLVKLKPKTKQLKDIFSEINIYFDKRDCTVSKLVMNEASGDNTTIRFGSKKINQIIPDEKFITP
jgi:outer membrane lipoprotein-sorting protein